MPKEKILVIEDNPLNMELITDLLATKEYVVCQAETAEEGIRLAEVSLPQLILMDIGLPGMDGLSATHVLKQNPHTKHIPVVALTAHAMESDRQRVLSAGCSGYITKPISTQAFLEAIKELMNGNKDS